MSELSGNVGPYEIVREIGRGGMGVVYLARDPKLDRDVAIKVLSDSMARDKERVLCFEREAKLLASLNHTNIAQNYGFEESDDKKFLVLECVKANRSRPGSNAPRCPSTKHSMSADRSPRRSKPPTKRA